MILFPHSADFSANIGILTVLQPCCLKYCSKYDEMAITLLQEAAAKKPQDIEVHKMLYELYERNGLKQELEVEKIAINLLGGTL